MLRTLVTRNRFKFRVKPFEASRPFVAGWLSRTISLGFVMESRLRAKCLYTYIFKELRKWTRFASCVKANLVKMKNVFVCSVDRADGFCIRPPFSWREWMAGRRIVNAANVSGFSRWLRALEPPRTYGYIYVFIVYICLTCAKHADGSVWRSFVSPHGNMFFWKVENMCCVKVV